MCTEFVKFGVNEGEGAEDIFRYVGERSSVEIRNNFGVR